MKKHPTALLLPILLVLLFLPLRAYAHPGRTDSNGGHTDHSTGEYHYHHGYPAHDHYDMDGDGTLDCPYDFIDRTGQNSGDSISSGDTNQNGIISGQSSYDRSDFEYPATANTSTEKEAKEVPSWIYWIIGSQILLNIAMFFALRKKNEEISSVRNEFRYKLDKSRNWFKSVVRERYKQHVASIARDNQELIKTLHPDAKINFRDPFPFSLFEEFDNSSCPFLLPDGVSITKDGLPALGYVDDDAPYGKYTVYITYRGNCYHNSRYCKHVSFTRSVCVFSVMQSRRPCSYCARKIGTTTPQWYLNFIAASRSLDISWKDDLSN